MTRRALVAAAVGVCVLALAATAAFAGPAAAGDNNARITFEPAEPTVQPGETVAVDVVLRSHGARGDAGVMRVDLRVDVPPAYLTITDVDPGAWFEDALDGAGGGGDANASVTTAVDRAPDDGAIRVRQRLQDPDDGVTGTARVATVTLRAAPDAEPATVEVSAEETYVRLTSRYPQPVVTEPPATVDVAGGGETVAPPFPEQPFVDETDGTATATTATNGSGENSTTAAASTDDASGGTAPEPVGAALAGVAAGAWLVGRRS